MNKRTKVLVFGSGGHGKVVLDILLEAGVPVTGFLDEDKAKAGQTVCGFKVLGDWSYIQGKSGLAIALGIGNNQVRARVFARAEELGVPVVTAVHPRAIVSRSAKLGRGVVVMPGAVINACASLADGVVVNTCASVDHDCLLARFCQIWPGAHLAGSVKVGEYSYVGAGASVIQNLTIGREVTIGAGAAVVSDLPDLVTAVGVPARIIKKKGKHDAK